MAKVRLSRLDDGPHIAAAGTAVLRDRRADPRSRVVSDRGARRVAPSRAPRWVTRRFAPHQLRHAHAVELLHEGIPLPLIQRQLGHAYLSTTGTYLNGISEEIIGAVHRRRAPTIHASAGGAMFGCGFGEAQRVVEWLIRAGQHVPATS